MVVKVNNVKIFSLTSAFDKRLMVKVRMQHYICKQPQSHIKLPFTCLPSISWGIDLLCCDDSGHGIQVTSQVHVHVMMSYCYNTSRYIYYNLSSNDMYMMT